MVQSLVEQGKLEEARAAKEELKDMQEQFDLFQSRLRSLQTVS